MYTRRYNILRNGNSASCKVSPQGRDCTVQQRLGEERKLYFLLKSNAIQYINHLLYPHSSFECPLFYMAQSFVTWLVFDSRVLESVHQKKRARNARRPRQKFQVLRSFRSVSGQEQGRAQDTDSNPFPLFQQLQLKGPGPRSRLRQLLWRRPQEQTYGNSSRVCGSVRTKPADVLCSGRTHRDRRGPQVVSIQKKYSQSYHYY